jgi:hypothetical protein
VEDILTRPEEKPTSRSGFLRRLGTLAAVGLGAAAVLPAVARAEPAYCCPNASVCGANACGAGKPGWYCSGACGGCCLCFNGTDCTRPNCPCA